MSTAEKIFQQAQALPEPAQDKLLHIAEEMARQYSSSGLSHLTLNEAAELRGKLAAWEDDWNAPGMEAYDRHRDDHEQHRPPRSSESRVHPVEFARSKRFWPAH